MLPISHGTASDQGPAALSITLSATNTNIGVNVSDPMGDYTGVNAVVTGSEAADSTATGAGGDGSYSYAWTVTEDADIPGVGAGPSCSLTTAGTQNTARYNSARWTVLQPPIIDGVGNPTGNQAFAQAIYTLECTVTDGTSATATAQYVVAIGAE
jgi:hypothetical protein